MTHDQETVILQGHIIDSLILAKVLDTILMMGGSFDLPEVQIGKTREEPSRAKIIVRASSAKLLSEILHAIQPHGASVESERDCRLTAAPADGIFPDEFYATTHLSTQVRVRDQWVEVEGIEMDRFPVKPCSQLLGAFVGAVGDVDRHLRHGRYSFIYCAGYPASRGGRKLYC